MHAAWPRCAGWAMDFGPGATESDMILAKGLKATEAVLEEEDEMADAMLEMDT